MFRRFAAQSPDGQASDVRMLLAYQAYFGGDSLCIGDVDGVLGVIDSVGETDLTRRWIAVYGGSMLLDQPFSAGPDQTFTLLL